LGSGEVQQLHPSRNAVQLEVSKGYAAGRLF
jgi:hypothetical protein